MSFIFQRVMLDLLSSFKVPKEQKPQGLLRPRLGTGIAHFCHILVSKENAVPAHIQAIRKWTLPRYGRGYKVTLQRLLSQGEMKTGSHLCSQAASVAVTSFQV